MNGDQQIVPGISVTSSGQATPTIWASLFSYVDAWAIGTNDIPHHFLGRQRMEPQYHQVKHSTNKAILEK